MYQDIRAPDKWFLKAFGGEPEKNALCNNGDAACQPHSEWQGIRMERHGVHRLFHARWNGKSLRQLWRGKGKMIKAEACQSPIRPVGVARCDVARPGKRGAGLRSVRSGGKRTRRGSPSNGPSLGGKQRPLRQPKDQSGRVTVNVIYPSQTCAFIFPP